MSPRQRVWKYSKDSVLWFLDLVIAILRATRKNERTVKATERTGWPKGLKSRLMRHQSNTCSYCGHRRIARSMDIDHMTPVSRGGSNNESNLQVICRPCNQRKGMMTDREFRYRYARLVPSHPLTPPQVPISQAAFRSETKHTNQPESVRQFRATRYISNREKIRGGSVAIFLGTSLLALIGLTSWTPLEGYALLLGAMLPGATLGGGVYARAVYTGMTED